MHEYGIPIDDQHNLMTSHDELHDGNIHCTQAGSSIQATQVVKEIDALLPATH
jgi:hypothetical protein